MIGRWAASNAWAACATASGSPAWRKRGGGVLVPLEFSSGEERYQREPAHDETPERIFERRWALWLLDRVVERLRNEFVQHGPGAF